MIGSRMDYQAQRCQNGMIFLGFRVFQTMRCDPVEVERGRVLQEFMVLRVLTAKRGSPILEEELL